MLMPLTDRVLIKPDDPPTETASGLVMVRDYTPENSGTVIAVPSRVSSHCPDCGATIFVTPDVKVGDTVLFGYDAGQQVSIDDERYLLIRHQDLSAILEPVEERMS